MLYNTGMDMFVALADPTRRRILELLATNGELSATALYEQFPVSPQAVSQHLKVLREAHLVEMEKRAQKRLYRLNPQALSQFEEWVQQTKQRWGPRYLSTEVDQMDVRPGGQWRFINRDAQGTTYAFHGVYHEVLAPQRV